MKRTRSALPLSRYVVRKPLKSGWGFFFYVPTWARKAGCPMINEPLGTDHAAAVDAPRRCCFRPSTHGEPEATK